MIFHNSHYSQRLAWDSFSWLSVKLVRLARHSPLHLSEIDRSFSQVHCTVCHDHPPLRCKEVLKRQNHYTLRK